MNRIEIRNVPWKLCGVALLGLALCILMGVDAVSAVSSPEAFAEALARAEEGRKIAPIEVIPNRFAYGLFSAVILAFLVLGCVACLATAVTAGRPAMTIEGDRIERVTPWGRTTFRLSSDARLTVVGKGLSVEPAATVVTAEGYRAGTPGRETTLIPMTWNMADTSVRNLQARLERARS